MKKISALLLVVIPTLLFAQSQKQNYLQLTRKGLNEQNAYNSTAFVEQYFRLPGNKGFDASIHHVEQILINAGFKKQKANEMENMLSYRIEKRPLKRNAWEPVDASIKIVGQNEALQVFASNRNMIPINCPSTDGGPIEAEVVFVGNATEDELKGKDLIGKIVFGEIAAQRLLGIAQKNGALGVLGFSLPAYNQASKHPQSIQFSAMSPSSKIWALFLSYQSKERLKAACLKQKVILQVAIKTLSYPSEELTLVANVRGMQKPAERFVFSAHVQEPGANDNASGVGLLAEMARFTAQVVQNGQFTPQRSLTFLWGDEITSTRRYIVEDSTRAKGILWGMSLDMVGEDTEKTGGTFLLEKMPDPSAIWTRGEDKHSEWGAGDIKESQLFPHYFNDFVFDICKEQGRYANWEVRFNPFEGGSDHTPFLQNQIPGLLMWHFTDVFYHTDGDRIDKVSAKTLKNVGVSALTAAFTLVSANEQTALALVSQIKNDASKRLATEFNLSKAAIAQGEDRNKEIKILKAWANWYLAALDTIVSLVPESAKLKKEITKAKHAIFASNNNQLAHLVQSK